MRTKNSEGTYDADAITKGKVKNGDRYGYKIVAQIFSDGHWCAYRGLTHQTDSKIVKNGDAIPCDFAERMFPTIAKARREYHD